MLTPTLTQIHRYPVKSMQGESLKAARLAERGLPGDRVWALRDEKRGGIRGAKQLARLLELSARFEQEPPEEGSSPAQITLQDGSVIHTGDADVSQRVSDAIDHPVTLWPLLPADALEHYRRGQPSNPDLETELRTIFARSADEPLPDFNRFPSELMQYECPPGTYFDAYPLLLLTQQSLDALAEVVPQQTIDVRRFRPNLVLDTGEDHNATKFPERAWEGKRLRIGEAILETTLECPRCVVVTRAIPGKGQPSLDQEPEIMRGIVKHVGGNLGIYARVVEPGAIRVGDTVTLEDATLEDLTPEGV